MFFQIQEALQWPHSKMALQFAPIRKKAPVMLALNMHITGIQHKAMEVGDDEDYHFRFDKKRVLSIFH